MAELDRRAWVGGIGCVSHGVRLGIRVDEPEVLARLPACLPPGSTHTRSPRVDHLYSLSAEGGNGAPPWERAYQLYEGPQAETRVTDLATQLDRLTSCLEFRVATSAPARVFVHAGVVEWRGCAIVIPGRSGSGKTTLVEALVRAGATYYSDEFAVLDGHGHVHPWARPLTFRAPQGRPQHVPVTALGGLVGRRPLPVRLIVVTAHSATARWRPRTRSRSEALLALLRNTVMARSRPAVTLRVLGRAVRTAWAVESRRGEADVVAKRLLSATGGAAMPKQSRPHRSKERAAP